MVMKILLLEAGWRQGCAVGRPSRELQFLQDLSSAPSPSRQPPPRAGKHSVRGRQSLVLALRWGCPVTLCSFTSAWKTRGLPPDSRGARKAASVAWLSSMELLVDPSVGQGWALPWCQMESWHFSGMWEAQREWDHTAEQTCPAAPQPVWQRVRERVG